MIYIKYLIAAILSMMIAGCSSNKGIINDNNLKNINISAHQKLNDNNYTMKDLEIIHNSYYFGPYAQQVQLDLIYAYYKLLKLTLAKVVIDRFLRFNPTHLNVDYVLYMRGITNMALDDNAMQIFLGVDRSDRNPEHARAAFDDFMQLIRGYPSSKYTMDASMRLIYLKNRLARYELSVVKYYHKRNAYVAVANRVEQMLHNFPDTQATRHALPYMEKAYRKLHLNGQADKVAKIIAENT